MLILLMTSVVLRVEEGGREGRLILLRTSGVLRVCGGRMVCRYSLYTSSVLTMNIPVVYSGRGEIVRVC